MLKIENNFIYLTRGDTAYITIELENEDYFEQGDVVTFSLKRKLSNEQYELQKEINIENHLNATVIKLDPQDTANKNTGSYFYDIQLTRTSGDVYTIVTPDEDEPKPNFKLLMEVTK